MFYKKTKQKEVVYSSTDLSDLLSSPVFYSVIALTFILGLSSIFGFFNNPRKLKMVVDVISQKILVSPNSNTVLFDMDEDYLLQNYSLKAMEINLDESVSSVNTDNDPYHVGLRLVVLDSEPSLKKETDRVSFDYDITSKQFWGDFDASRIESAIEEIQRQDRDDLTIGAPLSSEYYYEQSDNKYSMGASVLRKI